MEYTKSNNVGDILAINKVVRKTILFSGGLLVSFGLIGCTPDQTTYVRKPIVLSFAELRQPVTMDTPRPIFKNGKIAIYENYLLVNEPDKGVHVIDNSQPAAPVSLGFLPIAGNTDIVIKNNLLYANNYVDLVVLDISDIQNIQTHHRTTGAFTPRYNPTSFGVDPTEGVIVAFEYKKQGV